MKKIEIIRERRSVRTYTDADLNAEEIEEITGIIQMYGPGTESPFGSSIRYKLIDLRSLEPKERSSLGTYGFIRGARYFIACIVPAPEAAAGGGPHDAKTFLSGARIMTDTGYQFENLILDLWAKGFGTCWLGGTFKRGKLTKLLKLGARESIAALTPVGRPAGTMRPGERLVRSAAGAKKRKPWSDLFFTVADAAAPREKPETEPEPRRFIPLGRDGTRHLPDWLDTALECVRLGPSASNKQPWRLVIESAPESGPFRQIRAVRFYLQRTRGYGKLISGTDLQQIDMGIAMAHFQAAAEELGAEGRWKELTCPALPEISTGDMPWEYTLSWEPV